jgi:hypothetical protein
MLVVSISLQWAKRESSPMKVNYVADIPSSLLDEHQVGILLRKLCNLVAGSIIFSTIFLANRGCRAGYSLSQPTTADRRILQIFEFSTVTDAAVSFDSFADFLGDDQCRSFL